MNISPKFKLNLIDRVVKAVQDEFQTNDKIELYISQFQEEVGYSDTNFYMQRSDPYQEIDLFATLARIEDDEVLFQLLLISVLRFLA